VLRLVAGVAVVAAWIAWRLATDRTALPSPPAVDPIYLMTGIFFFVMILTTAGSFLVAGRSPHIVYRPEQIDVRFEDVKGLAAVSEDVRRSLDLFLSARTFRRSMGGTPRRGLLFEGPPGTFSGPETEQDTDARDAARLVGDREDPRVEPSEGAVRPQDPELEVETLLLPADGVDSLLEEVACTLKLPVVVCGPSEERTPELLRTAPAGFAFEGNDPAEGLRALLAGAGARAQAY